MKSIVRVLALLVLFAASQQALAASVSYSFSGDSGGHDVSVNAIFTPGSGSLTIVLSNNTTDANTFEVLQVITGLKFAVSPAGTVSMSTGTAKIADVNGSGSFSLSGPTSIADSSEWFVAHATNSQIISIFSSGGHPDYGIIGPGTINGAGTGGTYANAEGSIDGNESHNPFSYRTATFTLAVSGMTTSSDITGVEFQFGTNENQGFHAGTRDGGINPNADSAPEPATLSLIAIGAVMMGGYGCRRAAGKKTRK